MSQGHEKVRRSASDLATQLSEQVRFLMKSSNDYDLGDSAEAKRIAATLRILLHDSRSSHSLLGQIGKLDGRFLSTAMPHNPKNLGTHTGLPVLTDLGWRAPLEDSPREEWLQFCDWWDQVIFVDAQRRTVNRRQLVLSIGDQDGGHHIDPALDPTYDALSRRNSLNWYFGINGQVQGPIPEPERAAVRQIAHELLRTMDPRYLAHRQPVQFVAAGIVLEPGNKASPVTAPFLPSRNDPCPCGSGTKYKKCHGAPRAAPAVGPQPRAA